MNTNLQELLLSFQGRIRRSQWWLGRIGVSVVACLILGLLSTLMNSSGQSSGSLSPVGMIAALLALVVAVAWAWVDIALNVKRCHDRDKTGWFILIALIPIVGGIWLLIELGFLDGTPGSNKYGPSPKGLTGAPAPV